MGPYGILIYLEDDNKQSFNQVSESLFSVKMNMLLNKMY